MRHRRLSVLLVLATALLSGPTVPIRVPSPQDDMVVKHKWDIIPDNWLSLGPPLDDGTIELHIALQPKNENALTDALYEVSEPGHPKQVFSLPLCPSANCVYRSSVSDMAHTYQRGRSPSLLHHTPTRSRS